jgi:hypothetical protein
MLYPSVARLREVSLEIAHAVMRDVVESGLAASMDSAEIDARLEAGMWTPGYPDYELAPVRET